MKQHRKVLALFLAFALVSCMFAGCSGSEEPAESETPSTPEETPSDAEETVSGDNVLLIGGIGPLTGSTAVYGNAVKNGAQLAVDEINAAGGVNGMTLALDFQDDEGDAETAINAYNVLKDHEVKLLVGTVTSNPCIAVVEETHNDNMFQITPSGTAVDCIKYDNAFRMCFNDPNQGSASAQYISEHGLATKIAVIYDSSDPYSSGIYEAFAASAQEYGLEIVAAEAFTSDSNTDFSVQIQKVQESGAELLFLPIYYEEAALILTQAQGRLDVQYFGCDGLDGLIGQLGDNVALSNGVMLLTPFSASAEDERSVAFTNAYMEAYNGETPNQFAADAYDCIYAIKMALETANVTDASISASDLCELLKPAMTQITLPGVTGDTTWSADGEPNKTPKAMVMEDGVYKDM